DAWLGFGGTAQHYGKSDTPSLALDKIVWSRPVDLHPPYSGDHLLIHYGSPCITPTNTVVVPVKTGEQDGFKVTAYAGATGKVVWSNNSTYTMPPHGWYPSFNPTLIPPPTGSTTYRVAWPESGGRISIRSSADDPAGTRSYVTFYGEHNYNKRT